LEGARRANWQGFCHHVEFGCLKVQKKIVFNGLKWENFISL
jgi:hypothetical protein